MTLKKNTDILKSCLIWTIIKWFVKICVLCEVANDTNEVCNQRSIQNANFVST